MVVVVLSAVRSPLGEVVGVVDVDVVDVEVTAVEDVEVDLDAVDVVVRSASTRSPPSLPHDVSARSVSTTAGNRRRAGTTA